MVYFFILLCLLVCTIAAGVGLVANGMGRRLSISGVVLYGILLFYAFYLWCKVLF